MHRLACFILLHISYVLLSFPSFSFLSAILIGWFPLFCLPDHLFTLLCYLVCHLLLLDWFLSHHLSCLILIGSSSLLQWSAFPSIFFLNSFSIFIIFFLNLGSNSVVKSVSSFVLSWNLSRSFNWEWVFCFFISLKLSLSLWI